jgi:peptidoglycan/LPS O-acetylase OafA/YrhL
MSTTGQLERAGASAKQKSYHRPDVQGLRALAVIMVVADHAKVLTGGFTGVDVFFVISGFVITGLLMRELAQTGRVRFVRFYLRRAMRLLPALAVMSVVTSMLAILFLSPMGTQQQAGATGLAASIWLSNVALYNITTSYFSDSVASNPFLHTWSLGVEEQFYIVFPALLLLGWLCGRRLVGRLRRAYRTDAGLASGAGQAGVGLASAVIIALSFTLSLFTSYGWVRGYVPKSESFAFYMSVTRAWEFGVGCALAAAATVLTKIGQRKAVLLRGAGLAAIVLSCFIVREDSAFPGVWALLPVLGTAAAILAGTAGESRIGAVLTHRAVVHLGDISYSWYLWHWPALVFAARLWPGNSVAVVVAVVVGLMAAEASYRWVEGPLRRRAVGLRPVAALRVLVPAVAVPAVICAGLILGAMKGWGIAPLQQSEAQLNVRPIKYNVCLSDVPLTARDMSSCTWGAGRDGKPIYLIGDSNAQQFSEAAIRAGEMTGRPVIIGARGGCPLVDVDTWVMTKPQSVSASCNSWVEDAHRWLSKQKPGTVMLAAASEDIGDDTVSLKAPGARTWESSADGKANAWAQGLRSADARVRVAGHQLVVLSTIPHFPGVVRPWWNPADCPNNVWLSKDPADCSPSLPLAAEDSRQQPVLLSEKAAVAAAGGAWLDLRSQLCPGGECRGHARGQWLYRDGLHITTWESEKLGPAIAAALAPGRSFQG